MVAGVEKATLQLSVENANGDKKTRSYNILNEDGSYGYENNSYTDDMVKVDTLAKAISSLMFATYIGANIIGTERVAANG